MVKRGELGLSLRSMFQDLGIPMKVEIQIDSSTATSLTDRSGAGQRTKHIDTRYFWIQERVQDGNLSIQKELTALERNQSLLQYHNNTASLQGWFSFDHGSQIPEQDEGDEPMMDLMTGCRPDVNTETRAQKQTVASVDREHRDGCAS